MMAQTREPSEILEHAEIELGEANADDAHDKPQYGGDQGSHNKAEPRR